MEQIVVKTEMQPNEEILLFYVDEDGGNEHGVVTTIENIEHTQEAQIQEDGSLLIERPNITVDDDDAMHVDDPTWSKERWTVDETNRLLVFYIDNKATFVSGPTRKKHLWTVACKTMMANKNPNACEMKLRNLKRKYIQMRLEQDKGFNVVWNYYQYCHQAFHDDKFVINTLEAEKAKLQSKPQVVVPNAANDDSGIVVVKKVNNKTTGDVHVEAMLNLYLKNKRNPQRNLKQKDLWQNIALQLGIEDGEYWHKRFLNFKNNYIRLVDRRHSVGEANISWPYMKIFDQIYEGDEEFARKFVPVQNKPTVQTTNEIYEHIWNITELTVLVKYYFDCYSEYQDKTIPNSFLWAEVGRLIDKSPDACKQKFEELKTEHLDKYSEGGYEVRTRIPIAILFDNIISKDVQQEIANNKNIKAEAGMWKTAEIDDLVQFLYDNVEAFKDSICYFVCWAAVAKRLKRTVPQCRKQWQELTDLYKSILEDKKDNPDMQIDWRYIELFDSIFVYGMDTNLLDGYEELHKNQNKEVERIGVKKVTIKSDDDRDDIFSDDDESFDDRGFVKRSKRRTGESKSFRILEFYQKNKDKFASPNRKKLALWEILAKDIGISATQCAHRFRNLKQVYTKYVQREISKPDKPILWPYYAHCKKVFGYRAIKAKLRNGKKDTDDEEEWTAKEIKQLINYFGQNFDDININIDDKSKWTALTSEIGKIEEACSEKILELRKSYRKLKTMKTRNPDVKISWKYFNMIDEIYSNREGLGENMEVLEEMEVNGDVYEEDRREMHDDDYQCIIVLPEGQDINDLSNAEIIMEDNTEIQQVVQETEKPVNKWTKKTKKTLLIHYINYLRMNKGKEINVTTMWQEIAGKFGDKTPLSCRKMFAKLKSNHSKLVQEDPNKKKTPYYTLVEKILKMKPNFAKTVQKKNLKEDKVYKDVPLNNVKVQQALEYYLEHIEEFVSPKFEKKYLWTELAKVVEEPLTKLFNKINYLKQNYNIETEEVAGEKTQFNDLLKEIFTKETLLKDVILNEPKPTTVEAESESWSDDEIEKLLSWYLANLEKFKNPKFVRSYLWMEVAEILKKTALDCSKKMIEIRTQYKKMVKENSDELNSWRFYDLCQKIYGTGKRNNSESVALEAEQNV